jgi:hypothetical protein
MKRRNFIKTGMLATAGAVFIDPLLGCNNIQTENKSIENYFKGFQNPPANARLFVRWWWNGNRLDKKEVLRELDIMKAAGIGGVEINPIAFPEEADPAGYEAMNMFDDDWLDILQAALQGAKQRGMICDMIVGSGWPFGGEFLEKEDQTQMVTIETIDLNGGERYSFKIQELLDKVNPQIHSKNKTVYKDLVMVRLLPKVSGQFVEGEELAGHIKNGELSIDVPAGMHVLYYVVKLTGYMAVINGAPGAAGTVLNHYSKPAVTNYLNRISEHITGKIGNMGDYIRAMFCDSMELEGANWNDDLPVEFERKRGYSLLPYLPFVLKKVGHMGNPLEGDYGTKFSEETVDLINRVGLDFYKTRIELFRERFLEPFNEWCHRNNVLSRVQAYGRGYHPLEASMVVDIPECETWLQREVGREYSDTGETGRAPTMVNKYVSSAAALAGKKVVSCEEITNTTMVFMATLENIKIAGDQSNISGVNHSILHGFNYSPPDVSFPGWVRYGTWFNERNTWWPWFKLWADYKARISYLLQNATPLANIAILQPLSDLWLKYGPQRDPFPQKWYPEYQNNLWEAIHQNGGGCDYVSENIINQAVFQDGKMIFGEREYKFLLLPEIETLDLQTAKSLSSFAKAGGKIIFIGKRPFKSPAYKNLQEKDEQVNKIIRELLAREKENVIVYPSPGENLIEWVGKLQDDVKIQPYVRFTKTHKYLNQSCYRLGDSLVCFMANTSISESISVVAEFQVKGNMKPSIWDAETGERMVFPTGKKSKQLELEFPKATSLVIVFGENADGALYQPHKIYSEGNEINGAWQLQLNHIDGTSRHIELETLKDLVDIPETKNFAGTVIYEKTVDLNRNDLNYIDLGNVQGVSELTLNGKNLGVKWYGAHVYDIKKAVKPGANKLSVRLTTITGNYLKGLINNPVAQRWTRNQPYYSMGILGPVRIF